MLTRALIVLLLALNLGVAAWWALRPAPAPPAVATIDPTVARLQLVGELRTAPHAAAHARTLPAAPTAGKQACFEVGPFNDDATLARARSVLQARVARLSIRRDAVPGRGWRVWLPPLPDRQAAQAMAARIVAAGFKDYYVVPSGDEANGIALGRYGNAESAQRRQSDLEAAGFHARAEPLGNGPRWIQLAAAPGFDITRLRPAIAAQQRPLDCASLH